jgi:hypothetical protein
MEQENTYLQCRKPLMADVHKIFILFAALNAFGYNDENNDRGMLPIRKIFRKRLFKQNFDIKYPHLKKNLNRHHPWYFLNVMFLNSKNSKRTLFQKDVLSDLRKFSREPIIQELWKVLKTYHVKEFKKLFPLFRKETNGLTTFVKRPFGKIEKIILIINPLDAFWRGYAYSAQRIGYIVVGPDAQKNQGELIRHELLHVIFHSLRLPRQITSTRHHKHLVEKGYGSQRVINNEYIVCALDILYMSSVLKKDVSKIIEVKEKDFPNIRKAIQFMEKYRNHF